MLSFLCCLFFLFYHVFYPLSILFFLTFRKNQIKGDEWQVWIEYIDGVSGDDLTIDMFEQAAAGLGRFQGRLYKEKPWEVHNISCFTQVGFAENYYTAHLTHARKYNYIRTKGCEIPEHLRKMFIDTDNELEAIYSNNTMPVVLCHRNFWADNIIFSNRETIAIDWDGAGWGYIGEDIVEFITDKVSRKYINLDKQYFEELYRRLVTAYLKGFTEYADITAFDSSYIWKMFVIRTGYGIMIDRYMDAQSAARKSLIIKMIQRLYEMKDIKIN